MKPKTLLLSVLFPVSVFAQKDQQVPAFGKVEKADLDLKSCDFDKNAEAMILFETGELVCNLNGDYISIDLEKHIRIKILNVKGLEASNIHIPYHSYKNDESVKKLEAQVYNLDAAGNIVTTKVEKKLIFDKKINSRFSEESFTFPDVKPGSIIEYKYTLSGAGFHDWYFQSELPVKFSRFKTDFPNELEINCQPVCSLPYTTDKADKGNRDIKVYTMSNIPALRDEPYISCEDDYLQRLVPRPIAINGTFQRVSLLQNWVQIIKGLMEDEDFGIQLKKDIPRTADLDEQLKKIKEPFDRMVTIHNYVRKNMEYSGYTNIWAMEGVKAAWKNKKGTSGEINLILVNLLKDAGLDAHPVLVSTHENGVVNTAVADETQFNMVMAYVNIGDKVYVLDATDKYTPSRLIPMSVMVSEGMVIEKIDTREWGWKTLWNDQQLLRNFVGLNASIDENGKMSGQAFVNSYDYARVKRMPDLKKGKDKYIEKYFTSFNSNIKVDSIEIQNEEVDSLPLGQKFDFSLPVNSSGDYKYFSANMFTGLEKNPFVADSRFSDVFFGANQSYSIICNFNIPDNYAFEELPKSIRMIMPDTSISVTRRIAAQGSQLSVRINLDFKKPYFTVEEYADFKEFYKKLFDLLNEQIAIRKKANP